MSVRKRLDKFIKKETKRAKSREDKDGINNLKDYADMIWDDRWFDTTFFLLFLKRKLEVMMKYWAKDTHYVDSENELITIAKAVRYINKLIEDDFCPEERRAHEKRWGDLKFTKKSIVYKNVKNKKQDAIATEESVAISKIEEKRKTKTSKKLFKLLNDNYDKWWD